MSRYISEVLRAHVAERANFCCEYCRLPLRYSLFARTDIGAATIKIFGFNELERIMERQILINANLYPL